MPSSFSGATCCANRPVWKAERDGAHPRYTYSRFSRSLVRLALPVFLLLLSALLLRVLGRRLLVAQLRSPLCAIANDESERGRQLMKNKLDFISPKIDRWQDLHLHLLGEPRRPTFRRHRF